MSMSISDCRVYMEYTVQGTRESVFPTCFPSMNFVMTDMLGFIHMIAPVRIYLNLYEL
jgi:hypothetical protein